MNKTMTTESAQHGLFKYTMCALVLSMLVGAMFDRAFRRFLVAFEQRAADVYGHAGAGDTATTQPAPA